MNDTAGATATVDGSCTRRHACTAVCQQRPGPEPHQQVRRAIDWIRLHFVEPLAAMAGMRLAAFYRHFRKVTAMTPIQYQKRLRLLKARRQLLFEPHDAASAAFSVGYESASQFSRAYARMFGLSPVRDVARFKVPGGGQRAQPVN